MSLNNRISIRDTMSTRGAIRSAGGSFPAHMPSEGTVPSEDIMLTDLEKSQSETTAKGHMLGEGDINGKVISAL